MGSGALVLHATVGWKCGRARRKQSKQLLAETRLYGDALASLGATAGNNRPPALGLHTRTKPVRLGPATTVGLECALGHSRTALLTGKKLDKDKPKVYRSTGLAGKLLAVRGARAECGAMSSSTLTGFDFWRRKLHRIAICTMHAAIKNFCASNIHEINHSQNNRPDSSATIILCCGFFMLVCDAATEKTFFALSQGMLLAPWPLRLRIFSFS